METRSSQPQPQSLPVDAADDLRLAAGEPCLLAQFASRRDRALGEVEGAEAHERRAEM